MRLDEALDSYLLQLAADGRSSHTILQARRHLLALAGAVGAERSLASLSPTDVARYMVAPSTAARRSPATLNAIRSSLRTFLGYVHAAGLSSTNPARLLRRAVCSPPPPRGLSGHEVRRLEDVLIAAQGAAARRDHLLVAVMLRAGLRLGSALALDRNDIDVERGELRIRVAKRHQPETAVLSRDLADHLVGYLADREKGALFVGAGGERLGHRQAQRRIETWMRRAGIRGSAHSLRHTFAMRLYAKTKDILIVKEALRHRSIASTLSYAQASAHEVRAALGG